GGEQWSDKAALRGACVGRKQLLLFPITGFEPRTQHLLVHGDVLQQPLVADFIKASPDVALQNPLGADSSGQYVKTALQSIGTAAAFAKTIGVSIGQSLGYGCERQRVERLHGSVVHGGNAQGSQFAIGLGDVMSA